MARQKKNENLTIEEKPEAALRAAIISQWLWFVMAGDLRELA